MKNTLFKPFHYFQEKQLLIFGLFIGLIGCFIQVLTSSRTISILQIASLERQPQLIQTLADFAISTMIMTVVLYGLGRIINTKTRFIDIFNTVIIARIPLTLMIPFDLNGYMSEKSNHLIASINNPEELANQSSNLIQLTLFGILGLIMLVLFGYYIYQGFKTATHLKKPIHLVLFVVLILITDILTRLLTTLY
ncbi:MULTISPECIES: hypothetical protein [Myroides]|uniref:hypothetical protein n=1 Tax=Myroides odoratus TaxID=256 RepID=UPI0024BFAE66|nr:hypothetical protein [Myroides sp. mNGS23_01]WHT38086.1 hypothetical protein QNH98_13480 [Myroides sp. mNGS23_01]